MLKRRLMLALAVCLGTLRIAVWGAEPGRRETSVLASVEGLNRRVRYSESKIPLGELVRRVAEETGVALTAAKEVADEPVAVVVNELPARLLLEQVAELLDYQWSRRGQEGAWRYEIWQDLASRQREAALREALVRDAEKRFREELRRYGEIAQLAPEAFDRLAAEADADGERWGKLTPEERSARLQSPEERQRQARYTVSRALRPPIRRALAALLAPVAPREWERLREGGEMILSSDPKGEEIGLPLEIERRLRAARPSYLPPGARLAFPDPAEEERLGRLDQSLKEGWAAASGYRVHVQLDATRLESEGVLSLNAYAAPYRTGAPLDAALPPVGGGSSGLELHLGTTARDRFLDPLPDSPERQAALAKDAVVGAEKRFQPEIKPLPSDNGPLAPSVWSFLDLMPDLARVYGVQFLSDAYWTSTPVATTATLPPRATPLFALLDGVLRPSHQWEHHGTLIRIRSRSWFLDRPKEIPLREVRRWLDLIARHGALSLTEYAESAASLSEMRWGALGQMPSVTDLPLDFAQAQRGRRALRLYAALAPRQRSALSRGEAVSASQMGPAQRTLFLAVVSKAFRTPVKDLDPLALATARFLARDESLVRVIERRNGRLRYRDEAPGEAEIAVDGAPARPEDPTRPPVPSGKNARHTIRTVRLFCEYRGEEREVAYLTAAAETP